MGEALDEDRDGKLNVEELRNAYARSTGGQRPARETIRNEVVPVVDFDRDGVVSVDEFLRGMSLEMPVTDDVWAIMDKDGNGSVTLAELKTALGNLGGSKGDAVLRASFELAGGEESGRLSRAQVDRAMDFIATGILGDLVGEN